MPPPHILCPPPTTPLTSQLSSPESSSPFWQCAAPALRLSISGQDGGAVAWAQFSMFQAVKCCFRNPAKWGVVFASHPGSLSVLASAIFKQCMVRITWLCESSTSSTCRGHLRSYSFFCFCLSVCVSPFCHFLLPFMKWNELAASSSRYDATCVLFFSLYYPLIMCECEIVILMCTWDPEDPFTLSYAHFSALLFLFFVASESLQDTCTDDWSRAIILESSLVPLKDASSLARQLTCSSNKAWSIQTTEFPCQWRGTGWVIANSDPVLPASLQKAQH